jgi:hypothetical protein
LYRSSQKWLLDVTGALPIDFVEIDRSVKLLKLSLKSRPQKPAWMSVFEIAYSISILPEKNLVSRAVTTEMQCHERTDGMGRFHDSGP